MTSRLAAKVVGADMPYDGAMFALTSLIALLATLAPAIYVHSHSLNVPRRTQGFFARILIVANVSAAADT
jgi:hypothetical protein